MVRSPRSSELRTAEAERAAGQVQAADGQVLAVQLGAEAKCRALADQARQRREPAGDADRAVRVQLGRVLD